MKNTFYIALAAVAISTGLAACSSESHQSDMNGLPETAQKVVTDNFQSQVADMKVEKNTIGADEYEVRLADGTVIKFENDAWEEVKVPAGSSVPGYFVPAPIDSFVREKHPGTEIVEIEKDSKGYEVKLSNGVDVKFAPNGGFVAYDD